MKLSKLRTQSISAILVSAFGLWGCVEYTVETTLNGDGSGIRSERVEVDESEDVDYKPSPDTFVSLMNVSEGQGWRHRTGIRDGDETHVFERETRVRGLADWANLSGSLHISAVAAGDESGGPAGGAVDPVYAGVGFWNSVQVEGGRAEEGPTYAYRERFYWKDLIGVLIDFEMAEFRRSFRDRYPALDPETRGQVIGLVKDGLWTTAEQGRWDMSESERAKAFAPLVARLTAESVRLLRASYPDADEGFFADAYRRLLVEPSEEFEARLEDWLEKELPGAVLAGNTEIVYRLNMPGRVVDSNADDRDGSTLVWKFSPWDAIVPIEVYAQSRLEE